MFPSESASPTKRNSNSHHDVTLLNMSLVSDMKILQENKEKVQEPANLNLQRVTSLIFDRTQIQGKNIFDGLF